MSTSVPVLSTTAMATGARCGPGAAQLRVDDQLFAHDEAAIRKHAGGRHRREGSAQGEAVRRAVVILRRGSEQGEATQPEVVDPERVTVTAHCIDLAVFAGALARASQRRERLSIGGVQPDDRASRVRESKPVAGEWGDGVDVLERLAASLIAPEVQECCAPHPGTGG